jgi:hypothetical protein
MDISVSRLNSRMALQVPPELPLGLVFVVGHATRLYVPRGESNVVAFQLVDGEHRLRTRLPRAVAEETLLAEGDRVRVSGTLAFDPRRAQYYLAASDLEVLPRRDPETSLQPILNDARRRAEQLALDRADLPPWVQKLAPPEVQREMAALNRGHLEEEESAPPEPETAATSTALVQWSADAAPPRLQPPAPPDEELVDFLSGAMDSQDEVELTPEMIDRYLGPAGEEQEADPDFPAIEEVEMPAHEATPDASPNVRQPASNRPAVISEDITNNSTLQLALLGLLVLLLLASVLVLMVAVLSNQ